MINYQNDNFYLPIICHFLNTGSFGNLHRDKKHLAHKQFFRKKAF